MVAIAGGEHFSLALKADGTVVAWGLNDNGQLNIPTGLSNVVEIAASNVNGLATISDGPPFLSNPLFSTTSIAGSPVLLQVAAAGIRPLSYQWRFGGINLPGATNAMLSLTPVQPAQAGYYSVLISNAFGSITTGEALLTVLPLLIVAPPQSQTVLANGTASFEVLAQSSLPASYQWQFNGTNLPGATKQPFDSNQCATGSGRTLFRAHRQFSWSGN